MPRISPLAVIDPSANIAEDVEIGPFCVIGPDVTLGGGCRLLNSVTVIGKTTIGRDNVFFPNCVIGTYPQDKKFKGAPTELHIGSATCSARRSRSTSAPKRAAWRDARRQQQHVHDQHAHRATTPRSAPTACSPTT